MDLYDNLNTDIKLTKPYLSKYKELKAQYKCASIYSQVWSKDTDTRRIEMQNDSISVTIKGKYDENDMKKLFQR